MGGGQSGSERRGRVGGKWRWVRCWGRFRMDKGGGVGRLLGFAGLVHFGVYDQRRMDGPHGL
jgi:hypothetical protein